MQVLPCMLLAVWVFQERGRAVRCAASRVHIAAAIPTKTTGPLTAEQHAVDGDDGLVVVGVHGLASDVDGVALGVGDGHLAIGALELEVIIACAGFRVSRWVGRVGNECGTAAVATWVSGSD